MDQGYDMDYSYIRSKVTFKDDKDLLPLKDVKRITLAELKAELDLTSSDEEDECKW